ncbi:MraY family glycosyltransferase [Xylophilus sp. ASV27]|uniref:MraY family glycosyltransferase n=1 Tax=Xylophilus sp. ASV27 TaxID=2795129 RepID=UPI0018EC931C|nr:glycosyltransferase [Xylophilus sp. ASV27]
MVFLFCLSAFAAAYVAILLIRRARGHARRYGKSKPQRFHVGDIPRVGGLAIFAGTACGWTAAAVAFHFENRGFFDITLAVALAWAAISLPALIGGVAEDLTQRLAVVFRLLLTGGSAVMAVVMLDLSMVRVGIPGVDALLAGVPLAGTALALVAVAGLPHAFNIIDGYNGLAGMVALVACLALTYVALQVGDRQLAGILLCLAGATAGFLFWNFPRGMIFAGDGGAYFWGVCIAVASLVLVKRHPQVSPWFPMLLLIYPVWETFFSIYRKLTRGMSPSVADALHFHQLIYRRVVHRVFHDDETRRILMRNNRTAPYLWAFTMLTVVPATMFWRTTWVLMLFCALFALSYVGAYLMIVRFKVPRWLRR